jgi:tetratricopeptide (TPR) repeat protein
MAAIQKIPDLWTRRIIYKFSEYLASQQDQPPGKKDPEIASTDLMLGEISNGMNILKFIKGKTPMQHEQKGDLHFASGAWGEAKLEYDTALNKLERDPAAIGEQTERLHEKLRSSKEALSRQHLVSGNNLFDAGYPQEAREYYLLGLELTNDEQLRSLLESGREKTKSPPADELNTSTVEDMPAPDDMAEKEVISADNETYFNALCNTLPQDIRKIYKKLGQPFRNGYIALNRGDFETAVKALSRAQEDQPSDGSYIALELATAYLNLDQDEAARSLLEPFLRHHPDALPAYRMLCEIFWENGDYAGAEHLLAKIPQSLRESEAFVLLHGETMYRQQRYPEAIAWYRAALSKYGWNDNIARALAVSFDTANQMELARDLYGEIMQRCSSCAAPSAYAAHVDPFIRRRYAELSLAAGDHSTKILELFLSLVRDDPVNARIYYRNISRIYSRSGDKSEAFRFQTFADNIENNEKDGDKSR